MDGNWIREKRIPLNNMRYRHGRFSWLLHSPFDHNLLQGRLRNRRLEVIGAGMNGARERDTGGEGGACPRGP